MKNVWKLIASIIICQLAGIIGALFNQPSIKTWYTGLSKPLFTPPNWVFGPVWVILFLIMGVSLYISWKTPASSNLKYAAMIAFTVQLILNTSWSYFFFYLQNPLYGLIEISILWVFILVTIFLFYKIRPVAGLLLIPYFLWVTFATLLTFSIWNINK